VPPRTPPEIVGKLSHAVAEILALSDVAERLHDFSVTAVETSPVETAACLKQETER